MRSGVRRNVRTSRSAPPRPLGSGSRAAVRDRAEVGPAGRARQGQPPGAAAPGSVARGPSRARGSWCSNRLTAPGRPSRIECPGSPTSSRDASQRDCLCALGPPTGERRQRLSHLDDPGREHAACFDADVGSVARVGGDMRSGSAVRSLRVASVLDQARMYPISSPAICQPDSMPAGTSLSTITRERPVAVLGEDAVDQLIA
jgi:hypothetical protein